MADVFAHGVDRLVVIGDDAPGIRSDDLQSALEAISGSAPTAVVGPSRDGGFYLLALNRPAPGVLRGIPWGSRRTLAELRRRLHDCGFEVRTLRPLADIDDRPGVQRYAARASRRDPATLRALRVRIAAWLRVACAWAAPLSDPPGDERLARILPSRAPPVSSLFR
jgi:hypothetical protein